MSLTARQITSNDYPMLVGWWQGHGWPVLPPDLLPSTGLVIEQSDGKPAVAGFLYLTNSAFCVLEWIVSDPLCQKEIRGEAVNLLLSTMIKWCEELGCKAIYSSLDRPALIERYKAHGFEVGDIGTNMIRRI